MENILMYSKTVEELLSLTKKVLQKLLNKVVCLNTMRYVFHAHVVEFFGYTIGQNSVNM